MPLARFLLPQPPLPLPFPDCHPVVFVSSGSFIAATFCSADTVKSFLARRLTPELTINPRSCYHSDQGLGWDHTFFLAGLKSLPSGHSNKNVKSIRLKDFSILISVACNRATFNDFRIQTFL